MRASPPILSRRGSGVVVDVGSTAAIRPRPGSTWRNGCRGAVNIASRSLAVEPAPRGSRVDAVVPPIGAAALLESFKGPPDTSSLEEIEYALLRSRHHPRCLGRQPSGGLGSGLTGLLARHVGFDELL